MTRSKKDIEVSERLIAQISARFGDRGRFTLLEEASGIAANRWKNLYYGKQAATAEQLNFWTATYPEDEIWILTGKEDDGGYLFGTPTESAMGRDSVGDRLNWVIEEFASPRGNDLIDYLTDRYGSTITRAEWKKLLLRQAEPTMEMVELICRERPHFAAWVVLGFAPHLSVDPTNEESIKAWKKQRIDELEALLSGISRS